MTVRMGTDRYVDYEPRDAYALLLDMPDGDFYRGRPLGTCFAFRYAQRFLTARHCVPSWPSNSLFIAWQGRASESATVRPAIAVDRHPTADIAVVTVEPHIDDPSSVFTDIEDDDQLILGEDACAYGFEINDPGSESLTTPRFFRGYFQRFMRHRSEVNRSEYLAGELNFPAPIGLSGAAVYRPQRFPAAAALVTENYESFTGTSHEVEERAGRTIIYRRVVTYGVALLLWDVRLWLDEVISAP